MPTELEELVEFLHHGNTQVRQIATENLVPYSKVEPAIFKTNQLKPVNELKLLVRDYTPIAKNALSILINFSGDDEQVLKHLAEDGAFLETILGRLTDPKEPTAEDLSMLLANLSKSSTIRRLISLQRHDIPALSSSKRAVDQLIEVFNKGVNGSWNKDATYDYLAYVFADLAKYSEFVTYLTTPPSHTSLDPLTLFLPHTTQSSHIRRLGIASLLKNVALIHPDILYLLQPAQSVLPPLLLPLCSTNQDGLSEEEMDSLPEECQYLTPEHAQESDLEIMKTHLETLWLLATRGGKEGSQLIKEKGSYPIIRELHLQVEDDGVRAACERIVDVIMSDMVLDRDRGIDNQVNGDIRTIKAAPTTIRDSKVARTDAIEGEDADEDNAIVPIF